MVKTIGKCSVGIQLREGGRIARTAFARRVLWGYYRASKRHRCPARVILIVKSELADDVSAKVEEFGILVVPKPVGRALFYQSLKLISATRRRILNLKQENVKLQKKIEEIRLVDRAKCVLIQHLHFTEAQAHRYIEKQAMDLRVTRREVAENILKTYEM